MVYLSLSESPSANLFICQSVHPSICLSVHPPVLLPACMSICLSSGLSICPFIRLSDHQVDPCSICPTVCLSSRHRSLLLTVTGNCSCLVFYYFIIISITVIVFYQQHLSQTWSFLVSFTVAIHLCSSLLNN